jgi:hypothetical protein
MISELSSLLGRNKPEERRFNWLLALRVFYKFLARRPGGFTNQTCLPSPARVEAAEVFNGKTNGGSAGRR